jgi:hypothetical protein
MGVALYMDVHVPGPITQQLRQRGADVLTAQDDAQDRASDVELLERAMTLSRVIFTQDVRFRVLAENYQRQGRKFAGLIFGAQLGATIGQYVEDLALIASTSESHEWQNVVQFLPFERRK